MKPFQIHLAKASNILNFLGASPHIRQCLISISIMPKMIEGDNNYFTNYYNKNQLYLFLIGCMRIFYSTLVKGWSEKRA